MLGRTMLLLHCRDYLIDDVSGRSVYEPQPSGATHVVSVNHLGRNADEPKQQRRKESHSILTLRAVQEHTPALALASKLSASAKRGASSSSASRYRVRYCSATSRSETRAVRSIRYAGSPSKWSNSETLACLTSGCRGGSATLSAAARRSRMVRIPYSQALRQPASVRLRALSARMTAPSAVVRPSPAAKPPRSRTFAHPSQSRSLLSLAPSTSRPMGKGSARIYGCADHDGSSTQA